MERRPSATPRDRVEQGPDADPESVARTILLDLLSRRARSRAELTSALARRGVAADLAESLLDRFEQVGLVDDEAFAHEWVRSRQAGRGLAPRALIMELRAKGVSADLVAAAVDEVDAASQEAAARELVRRRLRSVQRLDEPTATRRLVAMLARRGYSYDVASRAVREALAAT